MTLWWSLKASLMASRSFMFRRSWQRLVYDFPAMRKSSRRLISIKFLVERHLNSYRQPPLWACGRRLLGRFTRGALPLLSLCGCTLMRTTIPGLFGLFRICATTLYWRTSLSTRSVVQHWFLIHLFRPVCNTRTLRDLKPLSICKT